MSEKNSEARSHLIKKYVKRDLLRASPFASHMTDEGFESWAIREAHIFPEHILEDGVANEEIIFSKATKFEKYKDKSVLIIGGGPSTTKLDFSKVNSDFMWSVNHFYLNPIINKLKIDMAMIMGEPDITSQEFLEYRNRDNLMIGFEIHDRWIGYKFDDYDNYFLMHTDFYSKLGACVRMIIFACSLGVKKVSFVGLDGPKYIVKGDHAFEKNKTTLPSGFSPEIYSYHYKLFWDYVKAEFYETEFENLGYGGEYHSLPK